MFLCDNYFIFVKKSVVFYKITRETGSARGKPVQHGKPVRAVVVHMSMRLPLLILSSLLLKISFQTNKCVGVIRTIVVFTINSIENVHVAYR